MFILYFLCCHLQDFFIKGNCRSACTLGLSSECSGDFAMQFSSQFLKINCSHSKNMVCEVSCIRFPKKSFVSFWLLMVCAARRVKQNMVKSFFDDGGKISFHPEISNLVLCFFPLIFILVLLAFQSLIFTLKVSIKRSLNVDCWQSVFLSKFSRGYKARHLGLGHHHAALEQ